MSDRMTFPVGREAEKNFRLEKKLMAETEDEKLLSGLMMCTLDLDLAAIVCYCTVLYCTWTRPLAAPCKQVRAAHIRT